MQDANAFVSTTANVHGWPDVGYHIGTLARGEIAKLQAERDAEQISEAFQGWFVRTDLSYGSGLPIVWKQAGLTLQKRDTGWVVVLVGGLLTQKDEWEMKGKDYSALLILKMLAELLVEKEVISKEEILGKLQVLSDQLTRVDVDAMYRNYSKERVQILLDSIEGGYNFFKQPFV